MMSVKMAAREKMAAGILEKMKLRGMDGVYAPTYKEALGRAKELLKPGMSVAWGGSATLKEIGLLDYLPESGLKLIDRAKVTTPEEEKQLKADTINADYFLMSSNAVTMDGMLINIDGYGNRVAYLCYGPGNVLVIAGMNKVVTDVEEGIRRVRNIASPPNTIRLKKDTPCAKYGRCGDCLADDCICSSVVITRKSNRKNRIKVILVGEDCGF